MLKVFTTLLCVLLVSYSFGQKSKSPIFPIQSISTDTTCFPACHFFEFNIDELIGTENLTYEAMTNNEECVPLPPQTQTGCLLQTNNPKWFLIKPETGKDFHFEITNSQNHDLDAAIWGPIDAADLNNTCEALLNFPISCDYSEGNPQLDINDAEINGYYLLLISNFSNAATTVSLLQPVGGTVKYAYHCPQNIQLTRSLNGNQTQNAFASVSIASTLENASNIEVRSGNVIELLPGFEASDNITFEAKIQGCINTTENYLPPADTTICEAFANHDINIPHIYTNYTQNEMVGTVFAKTQPEYYLYGEWNDMVKIGKDKQAERYLWSFRHPFQWDDRVWLRTGHGCPSYPDTRITEMSSYLGLEDIPYPSLATLPDTSFIDSPFWLSTHMDGPNSNQVVYVMYLKPGLSDSLSYRINEGYRYYNAEDIDYYEPYNQRYLNVTKIGPFNAPKDFVIDFTTDHGQSYDRYYVARTSAGGHFAVTTTFTRATDSTVTVNTYQGDINVAMKLGDHDPTELFGNTFQLGKLPEGDHNFPLQSAKKEEVLDENIFVKVRYN